MTDVELKVKKTRATLASGEIREYTYCHCPVCGRRYPNEPDALRCAREGRGISRDIDFLRRISHSLGISYGIDFLRKTLHSLTTAMEYGADIEPELLKQVADEITRLRQA